MKQNLYSNYLTITKHTINIFWNLNSRKQLKYTFCCWVSDEKSILTPKHEKKRWHRRCVKESLCLILSKMMNLCFIFPSRFVFDKEGDKKNMKKERRWGRRERMSCVVMNIISNLIFMGALWSFHNLLWSRM